MNNFFVTFGEVLKDHSENSFFIEPNVITGDYLNAFYLGTRNSLYERGRHSITITLNDVTPFSVGSLIAVYERAVGYYASFMGVNAYHQPSVELGKNAVKNVLELQKAIIAVLMENRGYYIKANQIAKKSAQEVKLNPFYNMLSLGSKSK